MKPKLVIKGEKALLKKLAEFGKEAERRVEAITEGAARAIADEATANAPRNVAEVNIAQSINASKVTPLFWQVNVNAVPIAAYVEFGTGARVEVAPEWKGMAWEFYVNGKGYLPPRPYLYPAYRNGKEDYSRELKKALEELTKKYS